MVFQTSESKADGDQLPLPIQYFKLLLKRSDQGVVVEA